MGTLTENSLKGGLIILASTVGGAVLLGVVGFIATGFVAEWLWGPFVGKAKVVKAIYAGWGGLGGIALGLLVGPLLALYCLSRTKDR